ncbi:hypothetical protein CANINC_004366 [Pichia inconspicua]|uniref:Transcription factor Pcc1 n=1 Tax=Pichia inconspicua TaxID=52247 RepID=A0A4T0WWQ6_9ASCO|nr:hypothetical protein CANINC_004366 [[Candida] inconspicua]
MSFPVSLCLNIPFDTYKQASIAEKTLSPDPILKQGQSQIDYSINDTTLNINVQAIDDRVVRVTVNNLLENLKTVIECFEEFDTSI